MRWLKQRASRRDILKGVAASVGGVAMAGTLTTAVRSEAITPQGLPARVPVDMGDLPRVALMLQARLISRETALKMYGIDEDEESDLV